MSLQHSPKIVTDGLVLCLDAANKKSYPGSGTVWRDLAGSNNGTLTNGPTFNSANGGSIVFDGSNDYVVLSNSSSISPTSGITVSAWCYLNAGSQTMIRKNINDYLLEWGDTGLGSGSYLYWYLSTTGGANYRRSTSAFSLNTWYNTVGVFTSGVGSALYVNGSPISTSYINTNTGTISQSNGYLRIGNWSDETFNGKVSNVTIYNRALSAAEIRQNFNALRGRFGI